MEEEQKEGRKERNEERKKKGGKKGGRNEKKERQTSKLRTKPYINLLMDFGFLFLPCKLNLLLGFVGLSTQ